MGPTERPHYLRFARAVALVSIIGAAPITGCEQVRSRVGCEHCYCEWDSPSLRAPLSCNLAGPEYCCRAIEGPLPPPELAV